MEKQEEVRQQGIAVFKSVLDNKAKVTVEQIIDNLAEGKADPLYVFIVLKKFAKIQDEVFKNKDIKELALNHAKQYLDGKTKTFEMYNSKITVTQGGYWDYSTTDDPYLDKLKEIEEEVKALIKARTEEVQSKAKIWHSQNSNATDLTNFGIKPFNIMIERMPSLEWEEGVDVIETNPPTLKGSENFRFSV